ncbi:type II secretion system protein GspC [Kangiella shandongensis]|uniref:type II secretion system protein GspC n=1 Tax=Kangiella shandongensis TaxID=2763258 RepID=UPI001CBF270B|nr:type II secretion system protein GspC [Kangiella shandongensis]
MGSTETRTNNTMNVVLNNFTQFVQQRGRLIARIVALILGVISLYVLAKLVWLWVDFFQPLPDIAPVKSIPTSTKQPTVNVERIAALHLFGEANAPVEEQVEAEETKLNLKLLGTYVSEDDAVSSAIIQSSGNQENVYFIGDKLKVRGNVTLHQVETLKVIIKNGGKYETLTLLEQLNQQVMSTARKPERAKGPERTIDKRRDARLSRELAEMKQKLYDNPQSMMDIAKVERVIDDSGQVSGYKVSPGKDPRMFTRLGLRRNDVITSVNGQPLNDQGLMGVLNELNNAQSVEVTIERNGQPVTLLLGISEYSNQRPKPNLDKREGNVRQIK